MLRNVRHYLKMNNSSDVGNTNFNYTGVDANLEQICNTCDYLQSLAGNIDAAVDSFSDLSLKPGVDSDGNFSKALECVQGSSSAIGFSTTVNAALKRSLDVRNAVLEANGINAELFDQMRANEDFYADFMSSEVTIDEDGKVVDNKTGEVYGTLSEDALLGLKTGYNFDNGKISMSGESFFNFFNASSSSGGKNWDDQLWSSFYGNAALHSVDTIAFMAAKITGGYLDEGDRTKGYGLFKDTVDALQGRIGEAMADAMDSGSALGSTLYALAAAGYQAKEAINARAQGYIADGGLTVGNQTATYNPNYRFGEYFPYGSTYILSDSVAVSGNAFSVGHTDSVDVGMVGASVSEEFDVGRVSASAGYQVTATSITGSVKAEASLAHEEITAEVHVGEVGAAVTGSVDVCHAYAQATGGIGSWNDEDGHHVEAGANIKLGADLGSAKASGTVSVAGVSATGSVEAKIGLGVNANIGYVDGVLQANASAACGIGVGVGFSVDIGAATDLIVEGVSNAVEDIKGVAHSAGEFVSGLFEGGDNSAAVAAANDRWANIG